MSRALTVSRVRVRRGSEREYLGAIGELTALAEARGWHLWLFRSPSDPELFLECSESPTRETHRVRPERPEDEQRLEDRLRAVAAYEPGAWEMWTEVRSKK
ncbi:MAG TPA: hypothetical protein VH763_06950 [Gemmatimonadales bacterium]|jgi:hypothetical protein